MRKAFIIVTVDGLEDATRKLVHEIKAWRQKELSIYVIKNELGKEGYAAGVNKGIKEALRDKAELFFVANPDISLKGIHPKEFFEAAEQFDVFGYAFKQNGTTYYGGEIDRVRLSGGLSTENPGIRFAVVDFVSGSLMGFGKNVIDAIGMWDEGYGMYYEDVDFCFRAKKAGLKVGIDTEVVYKHFENSKTNKEKQEQLAKNRFRFFLKYADVKQTALETVRLPVTIMEYRGLIWKNIQSRPFLVNFLSLNSASLAIKFLNFILFLFLIRFLNVQHYGEYTVVWALIGLLTPFADFGTTTFGITQLKDSDLSFNDLFTFRFFASIVVAVISVAGALLFHITSGIGLLVIAAVTVANGFSGSLLVAMTNKNRSYFASFVSLGFNTLMVLAVIAALVTRQGISGVFAVIGFSYALYAIITYLLVYKQYKYLTLKLNTEKWKSLIKHSLPFLLLSFFAGVYFKIDVFVLDKLKGTDAVGMYSAGYKFFEALLFLVSSYTIAATPVLQKLLTVNKVECFKRLHRDSKLLFSFGIGSAVVLSLLAPAVLPHIFHHSYGLSVSVFQITIFALPFMLVSTVYMSILFILKKTNIILGLFTFQAVLNLLLNLLFVPRYSFYASAWLTVFAEVTNMIIVMIFVRKLYEDLT